ncbi:MAG: hypothetical protein WDN00_04720 [Limisphaerales bacterium]
MNILMAIFICMALTASAQTEVNNGTNNPILIGQSTAQPGHVETNQTATLAGNAEQIRASCIEGRRLICGKILKVLPDGLIIESGYTNLMRAPLDRSWLVPGTATASRAPDLIEGREAGSVCVGLIFLVDIPKSR